MLRNIVFMATFALLIVAALAEEKKEDATVAKDLEPSASHGWGWPVHHGWGGHSYVHRVNHYGWGHGHGHGGHHGHHGWAVPVVHHGWGWGWGH